MSLRRDGQKRGIEEPQPGGPGCGFFVPSRPGRAAADRWGRREVQGFPGLVPAAPRLDLPSGAFFARKCPRFCPIHF